MKNRIIILLLLVFILVRVIDLDRDLPPGDQTKVGQKDEQSYNFTSLNLYHFGSISKKINDQYSIQGSISKILNNIFTYFTLSIFGNNYYGLRLGAVLASILIFLLFFHLLKLNFPSAFKKKQQSILLLLGLFLIIDFSFLLASRNSSPPIFRCLYIMLIITYTNYLVNKNIKEQQIHLLILGMACAFSIFFSYMTNTFILLGLLFFFTFKGFCERNLKRTGINLCLLIAGAIIGAIVSNFIYDYYSGNGILNSAYESFQTYSGRVIGLNRNGFDLNSLLEMIWIGIRKIIFMLSSNIFAINFIFLFFIVLSFGNTLRLITKRKSINNLQLLSFSLIMAYAAQAFFYNPDSSKWIVMMTPVFLLTVVYNPIFLDQNQNREKHLKKKYFWISLGLFFFACGLAAYLILYKTSPTEVKSLVTISLFVLLAFIFFWFKNDSIKKKKLLIAFFILLVFMPNIFLSVKYCLLKPEFYYRDACKNLNRILGDKYMAGVWSDGFRLYTKGNVFFPWYQVHNKERHQSVLIEIFEKKLADFTVDFPTGDFFDVQLDLNAHSTNFIMEKVASLYLGKGAMGKSIWVYQRFDSSDNQAR